MSTSTTNPDRFTRLCDDVAFFAKRIRGDAGELARWAREGTRDGYRTNSIPEFTSPTTKTVVELDGDGNEVLAVLPPLSDPVGEFVVTIDERPDPVKAAVADVERHLELAREQLQLAELARGRALPVGQVELAQIIHMDAYRANAKCKNPHCDDDAHRKCKGYCKPCHEYDRVNRRDAPSAVIAKRLHDREIAEIRTLSRWDGVGAAHNAAVAGADAQVA